MQVAHKLRRPGLCDAGQAAQMLDRHQRLGRAGHPPRDARAHQHPVLRREPEVAGGQGRPHRPGADPHRQQGGMRDRLGQRHLAPADPAQGLRPVVQRQQPVAGHQILDPDLAAIGFDQAARAKADRRIAGGRIGEIQLAVIVALRRVAILVRVKVAQRGRLGRQAAVDVIEQEAAAAVEDDVFIAAAVRADQIVLRIELFIARNRGPALRIGRRIAGAGVDVKPPELAVGEMRFGLARVFVPHEPIGHTGIAKRGGPRQHHCEIGIAWVALIVGRAGQRGDLVPGQQNGRGVAHRVLRSFAKVAQRNRHGLEPAVYRHGIDRRLPAPRRRDLASCEWTAFPTLQRRGQRFILPNQVDA